MLTYNSTYALCGIITLVHINMMLSKYQIFKNISNSNSPPTSYTWPKEFEHLVRLDPKPDSKLKLNPKWEKDTM